METLGFLNKLTGNIAYNNVKEWSLHAKLDFIEFKQRRLFKLISIDGAPAESLAQFKTIKKAA